MKKINYFLLITTCLTLASPSYAKLNIPYKNPDNFVYCPEKITCSIDGDKSSCKPTGNKLEYWDFSNMREDSPISKGEYNFDSTNSVYNAGGPYLSPLTTCSYKLRNANQTKTIVLTEIFSVYLEAAFYNSGTWAGSQDTYIRATCSSGSNSCPLIEPGLYIQIDPGNILKKAVKMKLTVNDNLIWTNVNTNTDPSWDATISDDKALPACSGVQQCKIDISIDTSEGTNPTYPIYLGSVVLDMMNDMRIVTVTENASSGFTVKKSGDFNTLIIKKLN